MEEKKEIKIKFKTAVTLIIILAIIIVATIVIVNNQNTADKTIGNKSNMQEVKDDFSFKFLKLENEQKNIVYSPLSIKYGLHMLKEGANGNTKTQIENVINELTLTKYSPINEVLSLANGIYIRDTYAKYIKQDYTNILSKNYDADIKYDSFQSATNVNKWIENKTLGIIQNMLDDYTVQNPSTNTILINALAIDMEWANAFDTQDTKGEEFNLQDGNTMTATMMHKETNSEQFGYYKDKKVTALAMDLKKYDNTQLEFVAIMPNEDLSKYINTFTMKELNEITEDMTLASETKFGINISIPKFSFDYNLKLKNDLIKLGIKDAFDANLADFSNMADTELYVGDALHKADIDFSEEGIRAAAVTAFIMRTTSIEGNTDEVEEIKIDKPFMYIIRDKETKEVWFVGTVYEPNSWEEDKEDYR